MTWNRQRLLSASVATTLMTSACLAFGQQGPVGQGLSEAGRAVKRGFQSAGQAVRGGFEKTRTGVHNMEVVSRVYSRLHWDKALTTSTMEIEVQAGGIAVLTGVVPSDAAKTKALALTAETVGVIQVVDQLTVGPINGAAPVVPGNPPVVVPPTTSTIIVTPPSSVVVPPTTTTKSRPTDPHSESGPDPRTTRPTSPAQGVGRFR